MPPIPPWSFIWPYLVALVFVVVVAVVVGELAERWDQRERRPGRVKTVRRRRTVGPRWTGSGEPPQSSTPPEKPADARDARP